jgi:hypothetical protein
MKRHRDPQKSIFGASLKKSMPSQRQHASTATVEALPDDEGAAMLDQLDLDTLTAFKMLQRECVTVGTVNKARSDMISLTNSLIGTTAPSKMHERVLPFPVVFVQQLFHVLKDRTLVESELLKVLSRHGPPNTSSAATTVQPPLLRMMSPSDGSASVLAATANVLGQVCGHVWCAA